MKYIIYYPGLNLQIHHFGELERWVALTLLAQSQHYHGEHRVKRPLLLNDHLGISKSWIKLLMKTFGTLKQKGFIKRFEKGTYYLDINKSPFSFSNSEKEANAKFCWAFEKEIARELCNPFTFNDADELYLRDLEERNTENG